MDEWTPSEFPEAGADSSTLYSVFRRVGVVSAMDLIRPSVSPNDVGSYRAQDEELSSLFDEVDVAKKALSTLNDKMRAMPAILPAFEAAVTEAEEAVASRLDVLRSEALLGLGFRQSPEGTPTADEDGEFILSSAVRLY